MVPLVPSLAEAIAETAADVLVGATDWCTHPAGLDVARVGGTTWPDVDRVRDLRPDLVVTNAEENRPEDLAVLRVGGTPLRATPPATVDQALDSLGRVCAALGRPDPQSLTAARRAWGDPP